ncbi:MAG: RDD family protein [Chitinophagaceae bacterium]
MKNVGIGTRVINFLIDTIIIFLISLFSFKAWNWYVRFYGLFPINFGTLFFSISFIYYTFFETIFARTPGKWLSYSKVINADGSKANVLKVMLRSLIRITVIDCFFIPFLDKPLHDFVSKTEVVEI